MPTKKPSTSPEFSTTRRSLLKAIGATGAVMASGFSVAVEASQKIDSSSCLTGGKCHFSELPPKFVYLNNGTEGTMPDCVISTLDNCLKTWATYPTYSFEDDPVLGKVQAENRKKVATFLGVPSKDNICITNNTTMGLSMVLMGLNFCPNDKVVTTNHEHGAITSPLWVLKERLGIQVHAQPFPPAEQLGKMDSNTLMNALFPNTAELRNAKALCVSHVESTTGVRLPLRKLREKANELNIPYLIVDGAQGMGMIDLTAGKDNVDGIENCDFYACLSHKWLNAPPGTGLLYMRNPNLRSPEFYPTITTAYSGNGSSSSATPMAELLQVRGCNSVPSYVAMTRAMQFIDEQGGPAKVEKYILGLSDAVKQILLARSPDCLVSPYKDPELKSGLTTFFPFSWNHPQTCFKDKNTAEWVVNELLKRDIRVRDVSFPTVDFSGQPLQESYVVRVSTGYFNTPSDVETFALALEEVLSTIPI